MVGVHLMDLNHQHHQEESAYLHHITVLLMLNLSVRRNWAGQIYVQIGIYLEVFLLKIPRSSSLPLLMCKPDLEASPKLKLQSQKLSTSFTHSFLCFSLKQCKDVLSVVARGIVSPCPKALTHRTSILSGSMWAVLAFCPYHRNPRCCKVHPAPAISHYCQCQADTWEPWPHDAQRALQAGEP